MEIIKDKELYEAYFGRSKDYYLAQFKNDEIQLRFSFYAFFFSLYWFVFRKMYKQAFILFLLSVFLEIILFLVFGDLGSYLLFLLFLSICGFIGNNLYMKKARRVVEKVKDKYDNQEEQIEYLRKKGGVSYPAVIVLFVVSVISYLLSLG